MSYNKKTWVNGEIIFTEDLNNIESGIEAVEKNIPKKISQLENDLGYTTEQSISSNYAKKSELHEHKNKDVLDGINSARIQAWDSAVGGGNTNLDDYVTKDQYNTLLNKIDLLEKALNDLKSGGSVDTYSITNNLTNVSTNNSTTSIKEGQSYSATLTCGNDYDISSVVVTMNGVNITNSVYDPEDPTT